MKDTQARIDLAVENEVVEEELSSQKSVEHQVEDDKVCHVEFSSAVLSVAKSSDFIKNIDLDNFDEDDEN